MLVDVCMCWWTFVCVGACVLVGFRGVDTILLVYEIIRRKKFNKNLFQKNNQSATTPKNLQ